MQVGIKYIWRALCVFRDMNLGFAPGQWDLQSLVGSIQEAMFSINGSSGGQWRKVLKWRSMERDS